MFLQKRVMKHRNSYLLAVFSFILGCMLTSSITNYDTCETGKESLANRHSESGKTNNAQYVALIFSNPENFDRRRTIRNTWVKLKTAVEPSSSPLIHGKVYSSKEWRQYFVVGVSSVTDKIRAQLRNEQNDFGDLLILPQLKDHYNTLSEKLLHSVKWIHQNYPYLLYLLKCDDDSFVRIDILIEELKLIRQKALELSKSSVMFSASDGRFQKEVDSLPVTGLYWGYFMGKARVKLKGRWAESEFFLCDRYLPYALGGGYVLSADVVEFIAKNSHYLQLYNSEDVSMGVWTAPLSRLNRLHDTRFDTEWSTRGCNDTHIIRHKQSTKEMEEMYATLMESHNSKLCRVPSIIRSSYEYNWSVPPSQCCKTNE